MDLSKAFDAASRRSEVIADRKELTVQAEERTRQGKGAILPSLNFNASYLKQESPPTGLAQNISPSSQTAARLTANQTLFRGFREFAGLRQLEGLQLAQDEDFRKSLVDLYTEVSSSFYQILTLQSEVKILDAELALYDDLIREMRQRVKIGRSRPNELLTVESLQVSLVGQREQVRGQLQAARERFALLTTLDRDTALVETEDLAVEMVPLDHFLSKVEERPELKAAGFREEAADEAVSVAKGAHLPSLDLTGNYHFRRAGINQNINWDVILGLTIPIYQGGVIQSRVREAASVRKQAELGLAYGRRSAGQEVRSLYETWKADRAGVESFRKSQSIAQRSYEQTRKDFRLGLTNNVDVVQSLTNYQASTRALTRAQYTEKLDLVRLEIAAGIRPANLPASKP